MSNIHPIAAALVAWFEREGKDYPWRRTTDPWAILVSEIMLQQTTIATISARYEPWMAQYPTPQALAQASEQEALLSWEGLGYYRRVKSLRAAAIAIVEQHGGQFPREAVQVKALPGIGDYTLGAVMSFAYNEPAPLVDANVSRVLARLFDDDTPIDSSAGKKKQWQLARELLHPHNPRAYNSALMELGQCICTAKAPLCLTCPLRGFCQTKRAEQLPIKQRKMEFSQVEHWDIWCLHPQKGLLMARQEQGARHEGMLRLPQRSKAEVAGLVRLCSQKYSVTRYKITRHLHEAASDITPREGEIFIPLEQLAEQAMASPDRKLLGRFL